MPNPARQETAKSVKPITLALFACCLLSLSACKNVATNTESEPLVTESAATEPGGNTGSAGSTGSTGKASEWTLEDAQLVIHVGKAGVLARLGHNHVISTSAVTGETQITENGTLKSTVTVQVADLVVDSQKLRASYENKDDGESRWAKAYLKMPSEKDIARTRANMLGERVLDADNFPEIVVRVNAPNAAAKFAAAREGSMNIDLRLGIKDKVAAQSTVLQWRKQKSGDVAWESSFETTHEALGMKPFSALGGGLTVAEELVIEVSGVLTPR